MERTDNDTWDLATSVGATATMVAAARAKATNADAPLIDDPFAEPLVRAVGVDFFTRWATGELDPAEVDHADAPWGLQRMTDLLAARTRYFDGFFMDATTAGIRQAVILASGLDARAYRLTWPAGMTVFEIDQPQVMEFKTATLADLRAEPTADLRPVPIDLRHDWPAALRQAGFDADRPTAWIAEGLLAFLPPDAQDRLLDNVTELSADGSRLATETFVHSTDVDAGAQAKDAMEHVTQRWREHGFDVELGDLGYDGERNDVAAYLDYHGWYSVRTPLRQLLAANGLAAIPETGDQASFADNYYCTSILRK
jgi:methyltransferase (TIGR00027 family)